MLLLSFLLGCSEPDTTYVILMGGQSNMVGAGKNEDIPSFTFSEDIEYLNFGLDGNRTSTNRFGPEVGIAKLMAKEFPGQKFLLLKYAQGGASLLDWAPEYDSIKAKITGNERFGNMYSIFKSKIDSLDATGQYKFKAFLWMQGERDARIPEAGVNYFENFKNLVESVRDDTSTPNLPVLFGMVNPPRERYPALDTVRWAQSHIASVDKSVFKIETDDLEKWDDNLHYSSIGQEKLGRRFGEQLIEILSDK
jgi:hypothetical protein